MKRIHYLSFLICVLGLAYHETMAQNQLDFYASKSIDYGLQVSLYSEILQESRTLNVYLPESFYEASEEHTYPLLMISGDHGHQFFHMITGLVKHLSYVNRMPECVVISVAEGRYYAPNVYTNGMWSSRGQIEFNADPDLYVKHLENELFPLLKNKYRVNSYRMIVGVSGSSVFPLHSLAKVPGLFNAHITVATADMIGMGYEEGKTFIEAFNKSMLEHPTQKSIFYLGIASDDMTWSPKYQINIDKLNNSLAPFIDKQLKLKTEIIPNEGHYDAMIKAMLSAMEMIFPKSKWSPKFREIIKKPGDAMANIDAVHQKLSDEYGFKVLPKAERWNNVNCLRFIGGKLMKDGRTAEAVTVMQRRVKYRPRLPAARHSLSEALEANGELIQSIEAQEEAIALARRFDKENLHRYEERLEALKSSSKEVPASHKQPKELSKKAISQLFDNYLKAYNYVFRKGATVEDVDNLYDFYTEDFKYNHPGNGDIYSRELLYNNTLEHLKNGSYDNGKPRLVVNKIIGVNALVVEQKYDGADEATMTLIKFRGDKIYYIEEYW